MIHYRQHEILSDTPSGLLLLLYSPDITCPDQVTMFRINTYLEGHIHKKEFLNINFDPDTIKSDSKIQSFPEHSA